MFINGFIIFSLVIASAFLYGLLIFLSDHTENKCEMTYMFQYPQYVRISQEIDDRHKKYGLYAYSEGHYTERARNKEFNGIPVLFIPGNAGSYKQVRSLASVAIRKALDSRLGFHFDYFTLDLNAELTGFNGALLTEQMQYANHSIYRILELYHKNRLDNPTSVIIIGHSMGGLIAQGLLASLPPNDTLISLVITLASPHKRPPVMFDVYAYKFYKNIRESYDPYRKNTLISLAGGNNDFLVPPYLTKGGDLQVVMTHVPRVWLTVDHLCILWCKQLVLALNRALFESVDLKTKQISLDPEYRLSVFNQHLLHNSGTKAHLAEQYKRPTKIDNMGEWIEYLPRQYSIRLPHGVKHIQWYMVRLVDQPNHEALTLLAINLEVTDWVYGCSANVIRGQSRVCDEGINLSHLSEISPSVKYKRRIFDINLHNLHKNFSDFSHVVAKVLPTAEPVMLFVDIHSVAERNITVNLPNKLSLKPQVIIEETLEKAIRYYLQLPQLQHITQAYQLFVDPVKCESQSHHATASLVAPWAYQNVYSYFTETERQPMDLRLYTSKPINLSHAVAYVKLTLDPTCRYQISIKSSVPHMFGQVARFYSPLLVANVAAVVLMAFKYQLNNIGVKGTCPLFFTALKTGAKPYYVLPVVKIVSQLLSLNVVIVKLLPTSDWQTLHEEGLDFFWLPLLLYFVSVGFVWILAVFLSICIAFFESTVHKAAIKLLSKTITGPVTWSDWLIKAMHKIPGFVGVMLVILCFSTCGGLALCLGSVFYFLKLTQMSQDLLEEIVAKLVQALISKFRKSGTPESKRNLSRDDLLNDSGPSTSTESNSESKSTEESQRNDENCLQQSERAPINSNESNNKNEKSILNLLREILTNNEIFFHFTLFGLWVLVTALNVPSVLTWARNFSYYPTLDPDPSFLPGVALCTCAVPLWQCELPKIEKKWYAELSYVIYVTAVFSLIYGPISLYLLNYILTTAVVTVTVHQLLAPKKSDEDEEAAEETDEVSSPKAYYDKAKAKLE